MSKCQLSLVSQNPPPFSLVLSTSLLFSSSWLLASSASSNFLTCITCTGGGGALSTRGGHEEMYVHTNKGYIYTYIYVYCDPSNTCYNWNSQGNCTSEMIERDQAKTCGPLSISHLASVASLTIPLCKNHATQTFSTRHATTVMHLCIPAFILSR